MAGQTLGEIQLAGDVVVSGGTHFETPEKGYLFIRGDVIQISGQSVDDSKDDSIIFPAAIFDIRILDPESKIIFRQNFTSDDNGSINFSLPVTENFKFGKYVINFSISKEGYETYSQEDDLPRFYVVRTENDIVPAEGYDFQLLSEEPDAELGSDVNIYGKISPSVETLLSSEEFVDPDTGIIVQPSKFMVHFHFTRPDGSVKTSYAICDSLNCDTDKLAQFFAHKVGQWSVYATIRWVEDGVMYEVKSNDLNVLVSVKQSLFQRNEGEEINIKEIRAITGRGNYSEADGLSIGLLDWSSDGKFILFGYYSNGIKFGMMKPDAMQVNKIDTPIESAGFTGSAARLSPSNDSVLLSGREQKNDPIEVFRHDIREQKTVKIASIENKNYVVSFDWMPDGNVVLGEELHTEKFEYVGYNLWLADSSGNRIIRLYSWSFDPIFPDYPVNDERPRFLQFDVSPDGKKIALVSYKIKGAFRTSYNLTVFDIEKKEFKKLLIASSPIDSPRWSPNSEFIVYYLASDVSTRGGQLEISNVDGTVRQALHVGIEDPRDEPATFVVSPDGRSLLVGIDSFPYEGGVVSRFFRLEFTQAIPEFPLDLTAIIGIVLSGTIVAIRLRGKFLSIHV